MVDAQTVKGGRYGPTFHKAGGRGGRTIGTKRTILVEILGLPVAAAACSARPHDVLAARELLRERIDEQEAGREDTGTEGPTERPTGTSTARDYTSVDPKEPLDGGSPAGYRQGCSFDLAGRRVAAAKRTLPITRQPTRGCCGEVDVRSRCSAAGFRRPRQPRPPRRTLAGPPLRNRRH